MSVHHERVHDESIAQRSSVECDYCGSVFEKKDAVINITEHNFCNMECRDKWQSENLKGNANPHWKGGNTNRVNRKRNSKKYKQWRKNIFERDGYVCQECGSNSDLHAHHIVPVSEDESKMFDLDNGVTLCGECHSAKHPRIGFI